VDLNNRSGQTASSERWAQSVISAIRQGAEAGSAMGRELTFVISGCHPEGEPAIKPERCLLKDFFEDSESQASCSPLTRPNECAARDSNPEPAVQASGVQRPAAVGVRAGQTQDRCFLMMARGRARSLML